MIVPAGDIVIPAGIIVFFLLLARFFYTLPLAITLSGTRNSNILSGEGAFGYGPFSVALAYDGIMTGELRICKKRLFLFTIPPSEQSEDRSGEQIEDDGFHHHDVSSIMKWFPIGLQSIRRFTQYFRIDFLICHARVGCGDPFTTGLAFGYIQAIIPVIPVRYDICIVPDFDKPALDGEISLRCLIITPISLIVKICRRFLPEILKKHG